MEKYTWLEELIESCQSSEELFETICEYIDENFILIDDDEEKVSKSEYDSVISKYEKEISELKESFENEKAQALIEKDILEQGGRNAKAIMALLSDEDIIKDESGRITGVDITRIKESAPYLFKEISQKVEGTGAVKERRKKSDRQFMESAMRAAGIRK